MRALKERDKTNNINVQTPKNKMNCCFDSMPYLFTFPKNVPKKLLVSIISGFDRTAFIFYIISGLLGNGIM